MYYITNYGAKEGKLNTLFIQQAIDTAFESGGGKVIIPHGTYLTGALFLKSNVELHLEIGAALQFSTSQNDYPVVESRWEGVQREVYAPCIYAENQTNIAVTGFGTLDGCGESWWEIFRDDSDILKYPRPRLISFHQCQRVTIKDIRLVDSPSWTVHPLLCENVTIDNVTIKNPANSPNTDGINPESCTNVRISNCHIDVGDDCIAVKAGTEDTPERVSCENITISNCTMVHGHGGVVLGSEMSGDIRNVTITNCIFQDTDRGIRLKSRRGRGGTIEDIRVNNIVMDNVLCPFILNLYYFCGPKGNESYVWDKTPYPLDERTPRFRRIHFANITARNVQASAGFIYGLAEQYVSDITFSSVDISMAKNSRSGVPAMMAGISETKNQGFYIGFSKDLIFDRISIENHIGSAFQLVNCNNIQLEKIRSYNSEKNEQLIEEINTILD
ncbi:glycoside hydrolase family 28 protein [Enterococcus sp. BWT-B8]|uniref:glycoside hydrolase family 28 protein n=1 Tax=Enterococcus sp. BWT-B8 TaxID=2885157 RepID=UPI001E408200|nr:glycoside hydrolase family 28 protein [Enterococcus sp. BWT-B8]MCB5953204.1 glycoside hydrolase family 28 protein [Enterococcus sp. BWT-B8]